METGDVGRLQKEIRSLKKQVERLEASRSTFELMVDRNDKLLSRQLEQTQRQAEELNRINLLSDSALDLANAGYWHLPLDGSGWYNSSERAAKILGDLPSPGHRYRLDEWAEHVRRNPPVSLAISESTPPLRRVLARGPALAVHDADASRWRSLENSLASRYARLDAGRLLGSRSSAERVLLKLVPERLIAWRGLVRPTSVLHSPAAPSTLATVDAEIRPRRASRPA